MANPTLHILCWWMVLITSVSGFLISLPVSNQPRVVGIPLRMVLSSPQSSRSSSSSSSKSTIPATTKTITTTPPSKYPTQRGDTVDSRKIVAAAGAKQYLTAIRLSHILFASEELARRTLDQLRDAVISFDDLARQISNCAETRENGGNIGWVSTDEKFGTNDGTTTTDSSSSSTINEHLDLILPPEARTQIINLSTKVITKKIYEHKSLLFVFFFLLSLSHRHTCTHL